MQHWSVRNCILNWRFDRTFGERSFAVSAKLRVVFEDNSSVIQFVTVDEPQKRSASHGEAGIPGFPFGACG